MIVCWKSFGKRLSGIWNVIVYTFDHNNSRFSGHLLSIVDVFLTDLKVHLSGTNSSHEGRVEVYHQGRWGTVCDDHWGMSEATVVCKMLNFTGAIRVESFGPGNSSFPILMDNVKCRGDEHTIAACQHDGWEMHNCFHSEDAGVVCRNDSVPSPEGKHSLYTFGTSISQQQSLVVVLF